MTIEGLGKKFQEARRARNLTLDEASRMTKIRPARLAEIEADDFSQFPSLAYAKGFLLIYGKFLDVDVTPYLEAFEDSERATVDGYSYLQENPPPRPASEPVVRASTRERVSFMPLIFGVLLLVIGFSVMKLLLNLQRIAPRQTGSVTAASPTPSAVPRSATASPSVSAETTTSNLASTPAAPPSATVTPAATAVAAAPKPVATEPEVRRAQPVRPEDIAKARSTAPSSPVESAELNRFAIRPLKKTYIKVTVDDAKANPVFERWISPADGTVEFRGQHISVKVLDPDAVQIRKNGKDLEESDDDVTID